MVNNRFQCGIPSKICLQDYFNSLVKILGTDTIKPAIQNSFGFTTFSSKTWF